MWHGRKKEKNNYKEAKNTSIVSRFILTPIFVIFFVAAVSVIGVMTSATTHAKSIGEMLPTERANSWAYYNAFIECFAKSGANNPMGGIDHQLNNSEASSGDWWTGWINNGISGDMLYTNPTIGYYLDGKSSVNGSDVQCGGSNKQWMSQAFALWGYKDGVAALCDWGYTRTRVSLTGGYGDCINDTDRWLSIGLGASGTGVNIDTFKEKIKNKIGGEPSLTYNGKSDSKYIYYRDAFLTGCKITQNPYEGGIDDSLTYTIPILNEKGVGKDVTVRSSSMGNSDSIWFYVENGENKKDTCGNIEKVIQQSAGDYKTSIAATLKPDGSGGDTKDKSVESASVTSSCNIDGVGWIICPVVRLLGSIVDYSWNVLQGFLQTSPDIMSQSSATYQAWTSMRSIANVAFVIAFLIIIFSQMTSVGITNYVIKKMLPRLVIAAILVNLSFFICQIAVDLSNILGYSLKSMLDGMGGDAITPKFMSDGSTGSGGLGIIGGILSFAGAGVILYSSLGLLLPVLLAAIVAVVMILFILVARQAIIILLVVISPLAFVAFLLPNTSGLFDKWRKTMTAMLVLFPVAALVMGASNFAAKILSSVFSNIGTSNGFGTWLGQIATAAVAILPLFIIPGLLKKSLDTIPALGALASKWSDKANSRVGSKAGEAWKNTDLSRGMAARTQLKQKYRDRDYAKRLGTSGLTRTLSGGIPMPGAEAKYVRRSLEGSALSAANKADAEDVSSQQSLLESQILTGKTTSDQAFKDAVAKNDAVAARAAMAIQLQSGGGRDRAHQLIKDAVTNSQFASSGGMDKLRGHIASTNPSLGDKDIALGNWSHIGGSNLNDIENDSKTFKITDSNMASQSEANLKLATAAGQLDQSQAARILATPALTVGLKPGERAYFESIAGNASAQTQNASAATSSDSGEIHLEHNPENWNDKNDPKNQFRGY